MNRGLLLATDLWPVAFSNEIDFRRTNEFTAIFYVPSLCDEAVYLQGGGGKRIDASWARFFQVPDNVIRVRSRKVVGLGDEFIDLCSAIY